MGLWMCNIVGVFGTVTKDPIQRENNSGDEYVTFTLADSMNPDHTIFWTVIAYKDYVGVTQALPFINSGTPIMAFGYMLPSRIFTKDDGEQTIIHTLKADRLAFLPSNRMRTMFANYGEQDYNSGFYDQ